MNLPAIAPLFAKRTPGDPPSVALGTMNFGKRVDAKAAQRIIDRAFERGVRLLDTANVYENGTSERIVGEAMKARPGAFRVATKVGLGRHQGRSEGLSPEAVVLACDESRRRLGVETIDVYYLHAPDPATPIEQTLSAVLGLVAKGHIGAFGLSNYASWQVLEVLHLTERAASPRPVVAQQLYNLVVRQLDVEYAGFAARYALHTTTYNALAGGLLARELDIATVPKGSRFEHNAMYRRRYWSPPLFAARARYAALAHESGLSLIDLAYRFLRSRELVDSVLVGPASVEQLDVALDALSAPPLSADLLARIDAAALELAGTDARYAR